MNPFQSLSNIVGQMREAVLDGDAIPLFAVSRSIGATYTLLFAERVMDGGVQATSLDGVDPAYCDRLQHAAAERLLPKWLRGLQSGSVADRAALQQDGDFTRSAFFNYVVRPEGRFHCLISTPYVTPAQRFHMIVGRPMNKADFSSSDIQMLHAVLPYVGQLIASGLAVAGIGRQAGVLSSVLDQLSANVVLVTQECRLVFANLGARRLLALHDGLRLAGSVLAASDPAANVALKRAVVQALGPVRKAQSIINVERPSGCAPFGVTVSQLEDAPATIAGVVADEKLALLLIQQPDLGIALDGDYLTRYYRLTSKEGDVAALVSCGHGLHTVADMLGISYNTARYHLRHVFEKTGTNRQSDLVRTILALSSRNF